MIRPNPTAIKTGDAQSELRRYASELRDSGVTVQGCAWIEATADRIDRLMGENEALKRELDAKKTDSQACTEADAA